ncbi:DUF6541 family protein [Schaalia sp. lx-260]|uniref:DUF6541 family protein n=1 Tax=Schaalia sp. lx-260 TaxID=2899082 RepID=UPI002F2B5E6A
MFIVSTVPALGWMFMIFRSRIQAWGVSASVTWGLIFVVGMAYRAFGIPFTRLTLLPFLGGISLLGWVLWAWRKRKKAAHFLSATPALRSEVSERNALTRHKSQWPLLLAVCSGWLIAALPMLVRANPHNPAQQWDAVHHLNGVWLMLDVNEISPWTSLAALRGGATSFYPNLWHTFVLIFSTKTTVIEAANVSSLLLMFLWVLGAAALLRTLTTDVSVIVVGTIMSGGLLSMPADALTMYNQWPHAAGTTLLLGLLVLGIEAGRSISHYSPQIGKTGSVAALSAATLGRLTAVFPALIFSLIGVTLAHPSALFGGVFILLVPFLYHMLTYAYRAFDHGYFLSSACWVIAAALSVLLPLMALDTAAVRAMAAYPRSGLGWDFAFSRMFTPFPPFNTTWGFMATVACFGILTLCGAVALIFYLYGKMSVARAQARTKNQAENSEAPQPLTMHTDAGIHFSVEEQGKPVQETNETDYVSTGTPALATDLTCSDSAEQSNSAPEPQLIQAAEPPFVRARPHRSDTTLTDIMRPWILGAFLLFSFLTFLSYAPDNELRTFLLGPWYKDPRRIMAIHALLMVPLAATGMVIVARFISSYMTPTSMGRHVARKKYSSHQVRSRRVELILGCGLLLVTCLCATDARFRAVDYVYDLDNLGKPGMVTAGELRMLQAMPQTLPPDARVFGDPIAGAAYSEVIGQRYAFFPHLSLANLDTYTQDLLSQSFNQIHTNPKICQAIREQKITHFYEEADGIYYNFTRSKRHPGFYYVDTSHGFELVDQGDTAKLWKITACN